eukprot:m.27060 g.27060  ORF g.27060 m.27060 type:complete len:122 (+) comp9317_c0_seq1:67-432(+)
MFLWGLFVCLFLFVVKGMSVVVAVDNFSFPSGHCTRMAALSYVAPYLFSFHIRHTAMMYFHILCYVICISRVLMGRHYLFDVAVGILLGWGVGAVFLSHQEGLYSFTDNIADTISMKFINQ